MCCENKATKRNYISQSSALLYDQIKSPRTNSSSIEMPESGYNNSLDCKKCFTYHFNVFISYRNHATISKNIKHLIEVWVVKNGFQGRHVTQNLEIPIN